MIGQKNVVAGYVGTRPVVMTMIGSVPAMQPGDGGEGYEVYSVPGYALWKVPYGVTEVYLCMTGGGQAGERKECAIFSDIARGGSPGKEFRGFVSVTPGDNIPVIVGAGGSGNYTKGEPSYFMDIETTDAANPDDSCDDEPHVQGAEHTFNCNEPLVPFTGEGGLPSAFGDGGDGGENNGVGEKGGPGAGGGGAFNAASGDGGDGQVRIYWGDAIPPEARKK